VQVRCCHLSNDCELLASGSRDGTVRVWRVSDGVQTSSVSVGVVDVFRLLMSDDHQTLVALADRRDRDQNAPAAGKLVLLRVTQ